MHSTPDYVLHLPLLESVAAYTKLSRGLRGLVTSQIQHSDRLVVQYLHIGSGPLSKSI